MRALPVHRLALSVQIIGKKTMIRHTLLLSTRSYFVVFQNVRTNVQSWVLLFRIQDFGQNFRIYFPHVKILMSNLLNWLFVNSYRIRNCTETTIDDKPICSVRSSIFEFETFKWWTSWMWIIFDFYSSFFNRLCHSKTCVLDICSSSPYTCCKRE